MQTLILVGDISKSQIAKQLGNKQLDKAKRTSNLLEFGSSDENSISIDEVRTLIKFLTTKPVGFDTKLAIIYDAQKLSIEAQNSLLKITEEPPHYAQIILCINHVSNLLPTVVSRCIVKTIVVKHEYKQPTENKIEDIARLSLGGRIDWIEANKSTLKDHHYAIHLLESWEIELQAHLMNRAKSNKPTKKIINLLTKIHQYKKGILKNNQNPIIALEAFLINI